jgi:hypothetical protein
MVARGTTHDRSSVDTFAARLPYWQVQSKMREFLKARVGRKTVLHVEA